MKHTHKGFSLVEILVGLVIGLIAVMVVMQVFSISESQKRTTTGGADASTNGSVALYLIDRDTRMAGWGLDSSIYLGTPKTGTGTPGCQHIQTYCSGSTTCGGATGAISGFSFAAASIADGGTGNPDRITLQYFADPGISDFIPSSTSPVTNDAGGSPKDWLSVTSNHGCVNGSLILVSDKAAGSPPGTCTLMQVSAVPTDSTTLEHKAGPSAPYNNPSGWTTAITSGGAAVMACFDHPTNGPIFQRVYRLDAATHQLLRSDNSGATVITDEPVASDIMDLQAEYGYASVAGSQTVDKWTPANTAPWNNPALNDIKKIKALRIALLVRSSQYEKPVSGVCTATTSDMQATWPTSKVDNSTALFKTTSYPSDWDCYRYKVFDTIIPLRNVIWAGAI